MKTQIYLTIGILFLLSIGGNLFFLLGEGIHIHNTYHQEQYQNQSQAQLLISLFAERGFLKQVTKRIEKKEVSEFCNKLDAYQYLYKDFLDDPDDEDYIYILYPKIVKDLDSEDPKSEYKPLLQR